MAEVNERSAARLTVDFYDFDNALSAPTSITYAVYVEGTEFELRADTAVSPASSVTIVLDSTDTQIVDDSKGRETHCVLIKATYSAGDEVNATFSFDVVNLKVLSGVA